MTVNQSAPGQVLTRVVRIVQPFTTMGIRGRLGAALTLGALACLGDPVGSGALLVRPVGGSIDSVWIGAPGEPLPSGVQVHITDANGSPIPGASVEWQVIGKAAQVIGAQDQSDSRGNVTSGWLLGTDAAQEQQLQITVHTPQHRVQLAIRARAIPHVVAALRVANYTPAVLRLGDSLSLVVVASDPFGNEFPAPDVSLVVADSAIGRAQGTTAIGGPGRGQTVIRVSSHGVQATLPIHVVQYVAAIESAVDTFRFTSIGAVLPVDYTVRDDRGRVVHDTAAAAIVLDATVAQVVPGQVRSVAIGKTTMKLELAPARLQIPVSVRQRVASIRFPQDSVRFTALRDTLSFTPVARDSLGAVIQQPGLTIHDSAESVASIDSSGTLQALSSGRTTIRATDVETGLFDAAQIVVHQVPMGAGLVTVPQQDGFVFRAAGDSIGVVWATDRNGFRLPLSQFTVGFTDTAVVALDGTGTLRAKRSGLTHLNAVVDTFTLSGDVALVLPVQVLTSSIPGFEIAGWPDTAFPGPVTVLPRADGSTVLYSTGYAPDSTQSPPFSGDLFEATSTDGVHFSFAGVALHRDSLYRREGIESVFIVPRDDGIGCRIFAAAGKSHYMWQVFSAVAYDCDSWTWEDVAAVPGVKAIDGTLRGTGEGMYAWQDSVRTWWMLVGAMSTLPNDYPVWTIALYRGTSQRQWTFVRTVIRPGPPGSGTERAVGGPNVVQIAPGLYRLFYAGDDWGIGPNEGRQRILSAVSRDRLNWTPEGGVLDLGIDGGGPGYPTVVGDRLYYQYRNPYHGGLYLSAARISQP